MKDAEMLARFDGRGRAEFLLGGFEGRHSNKITAIGYELGYDLQTTEMPSRSTMRLIFVRNDSPTARLRAQQAQDRLRAGGPLLPVWAVPAERTGMSVPVTAVEMASTRRGLAAYEANGVKGFAVCIGLLGLGCFLLAGALRDRPGAALAVVVLGVPLVVAAALTPRWTRRWYERNRRLVNLYDRQRAGQVGPPPPPPPPGSADRRSGEGAGQ